MANFILPNKPKIVKEEKNSAVFEIEGLYTGYGLTVGNALRRVLLSSIRGSAITTVKIKNVHHEFSTLAGVKEDVIQILLNLKKIRVKMFTEEPQNLFLSVKGEKTVTAKDFQKNPLVEIVNPDQVIANLTDKKAELEITATVEWGLGYVPAEMRKKEKLPIGTISLDAVFSPIKKVNFEVEDMRVGERTDYNRLRIYLETDGTISPRLAFKQACEILKDHFERVGEIELKEETEIGKKEEKSEEKVKVEKAKKERKAVAKTKKSKK